MRPRTTLLLVLAVGAAAARSAQAQPSPAAGSSPTWSAHAQLTVIDQWHGGFAAAYSGAHSLRPERESDTSTTATAFLCLRAWRGGELVLAPESAGGRGLSGVTGVAGFPNGDIVRVADPRLKAYVARAFLRQTWGLGNGRETVAADPMRLAGERDVSRFTVTAGKFSATDVFDDNAFSHDTRAQFMNWALMDGASWDYPADTRGYSWGLALELDEPTWALRLGSFMVPLEANGMSLDHDVRVNRGDVAELEVRHRLLGHAGKVKLLAYQNHARMGTYALATAQAGPLPPDVTATRRDGTRKYGFGLNVEQPLSDEIGVFARWGWNDGRTETWVFTEVDRTASVGVQAAGSLWGRPDDTAGIAVVSNGLSPDHRDYLAAGGLGFIIGDGALDYGREAIAEAYYSLSPARGVFATADVQRIANPAYNRARGPVTVYALRLHIEI